MGGRPLLLAAVGSFSCTAHWPRCINEHLCGVPTPGTVARGLEGGPSNPVGRAVQPHYEWESRASGTGETRWEQQRESPAPLAPAGPARPSSASIISTRASGVEEDLPSRFTAAVLVAAERWELLKRPSTGEWRRKCASSKKWNTVQP